MKLIPSIFNDVMGPVMRGPSSSHCAAAFRIGRICRDLMKGNISAVEVTFDKNGSLATTHKSQGSDMGLFAGLLGWDVDDERMIDSEKELLSRGIKLSTEIKETGALHPNTYEIKLSNELEHKSIKAISPGGGMIEMIEIDGAPLSIKGDFYELLIQSAQTASLKSKLINIRDAEIIEIPSSKHTFIQLRRATAFDEVLIKKMSEFPEVISFRYLHPVLPVISQRKIEVPFQNAAKMLAYGQQYHLKLWELAVVYESKRARISESEVMQQMREIVKVMDHSIRNGLAGTTYNNRILGPQSLNFKKKMQSSSLLESGMLNTMILYVSAVMESKSSMGVIVAAPTAGSCGTIPGSLIAAAEHLKSNDDDLIKAMLAAGLIGVFICTNATFAAEIGGCQAECGAASAMAAAGLVSLMNGDINQAMNAASLALQNSLGMICDPIANRVEAPCLGKNIMAASNALSCANMALADYDPLVSFDEVVETMLAVGKSLPHELRCTALGGLSITASSKKIENHLNQLNNE